MTSAQRTKAIIAAREAARNKDTVKVTANLYFKREGGVWFKYVTKEVVMYTTDWVRNKETDLLERVTRTFKKDVTNRYTANKKEIRDYKLNSKR